MYIIVSGHGQFSIGMVDSLEMIAGKQENLVAVPFLQTDSVEDYSKKLAEKLKSVPEEEGILVFTDLMGGTPYKTAVELTLNRENLSVIGGTNLSVLLEAVALRFSFDDAEELVNIIIPSAKDSLSASTLILDTLEVEEEITDGI